MCHADNVLYLTSNETQKEDLYTTVTAAIEKINISKISLIFTVLRKVISQAEVSNFSCSFSFEMVVLGLLHIQTEQSASLLCFSATDAL